MARDAGLDVLAWIAGLAELSAPGCFAVGATGFTSVSAILPSIGADRSARALEGRSPLI